MLVIFTTNIDAYRGTGAFIPFESENGVPRVGDMVAVAKGYESMFTDKRLPTRLQVVAVCWSIHRIECELHYSELQTRQGKEYGINLFP